MLCFYFLDEDQITARTWLVHGRSPIEMVRSKWEACFELRREDIANAKDLPELFQLYPIFRNPKSDALVNFASDTGLSMYLHVNFIHRLHSISKESILERPLPSTVDFRFSTTSFPHCFPLQFLRTKHTNLCTMRTQMQRTAMKKITCSACCCP